MTREERYYFHTIVIKLSTVMHVFEYNDLVNRCKGMDISERMVNNLLDLDFASLSNVRMSHLIKISLAMGYIPHMEFIDKRETTRQRYLWMRLGTSLFHLATRGMQKRSEENADEDTNAQEQP